MSRADLLAICFGLAVAAAFPAPARAQVVSYTTSMDGRQATLELDLASGQSRTLSLVSGQFLLDGRPAGRYTVNGPLDRSWRHLLADATLDTPHFLDAAHDLKLAGLSGSDLAAGRLIGATLDSLRAAPAVAPLAAAAQAPGAAPAGAASAQAAAAPESAAPLPPLPVIAPFAPGAPAAAPVGPSPVSDLFSGVKNVVALFVALAMLGFGLAFLARRNLEIVADTASQAFGRSLVVGLLGQLLLLPTLAMLIVGLIFTIVGILLLPFAVIAFVVAAAVALLGGYLAVAHAIGESVARRRMANGAFVRVPNAYGYLFTGLVGLLGLWAAAALFSWAGPVVYVFRAAAFVVTWLAATVGFGAVLLSRAGLRDTFAGRYMGDASSEYLWATPPATPAASRPGGGRSRGEGRE